MARHALARLTIEDRAAAGVADQHPERDRDQRGDQQRQPAVAEVGDELLRRCRPDPPQLAEVVTQSQA